MAEFKSTQVTNLDADTVIKPNELHGRVRVAYFTFETPVATVAVNDTVRLCRIPEGARILRGPIHFDAMTSGAGDSSIQMGVTGDATGYLGTTSVDAAGQADFANTLATNFGDERAAETDIIATAVTEAWAASQTLNGFVEYVVD